MFIVKNQFIILLLIVFNSLCFSFEARVNSQGEYWRFDNSQPIEYYINLGNLEAAVNRDEIIDGIRQAFDYMDNHPNFAIDFSFMGLTTDLPELDNTNIVYIDTDNTYLTSVGLTFNQNHVDETARTLSTDIALSGNITASNIQRQYFALTLHELLHFLGLDHSTSGNDSAVFANTVHTSISADDIAGIATLYPDLNNPLSGITGVVKGRIVTYNQFPVDARIVAYDQSMQNSQPRVVTVRTNNSPTLLNHLRGRYQLSGIPPGDYHLVVESAGDKFIHTYLNNGESMLIGAGEEYNGFDLQLPEPPFLLSSNLWTRKATHNSLSNLTYYGYGHKIHAINRFNHITKRFIQRVDDLAFSRDQKELYVIDQVEDKVVIIDVDASSVTFNTVVDEITGLPRQPLSIAINSKNIAFVSTHSGKSVVVIDMNTRQIVGNVLTGFLNHQLTLSKDEKKVYLGGVFNSNWKIFEINVDNLSPAYLTIQQQLVIGSSRAYLVRSDYNNHHVYVGAKDGLEIRSSFDFSLIKSIVTGFSVVSIEPSIDGSAIYFLGVDNVELKNIQLWKLDIASLTVIEKTTLGYPFSYISSTRKSGKLLFSGRGGLASVFVDSPGEEIFSNSFE